jgi:hypothetical protein
MYLRPSEGLGRVSEPNNSSWMQNATGIGQAAPLAPMPRVVSFIFRSTNGERTDPDNCCTICRRTLPDGTQNGTGIRLGVGPGGTAFNGMEMQFTISGHRRGLEYDIVRTLRDSLWERRAGGWTRLAFLPMGTGDDRRDRDECLIPRRNRIFVVDVPGWHGLILPAPNGTRFPYTFPDGRVIQTNANAREVVWRLSFAEWVSARSRSENIGWTRLELPPRRDGTPRRFIFWHSITWLRRNASDQWVLDPARSRIALGALGARVIHAAPAP